jgi:hypothetical protein
MTTGRLLLVWLAFSAGAVSTVYAQPPHTAVKHVAKPVVKPAVKPVAKPVSVNSHAAMAARRASLGGPVNKGPVNKGPGINGTGASRPHSAEHAAR